MAWDFPNAPVVDEVFTPPEGPPYQWDGTAWYIKPLVFNAGTVIPSSKVSSGNYIKPPGLRGLEVTVVGAGGSGSGCSPTGAGQSSAGGGGGAGGVVSHFYMADELAASEPFTIGVGGAMGQTGTPGGASTFKGLTAAGGNAPQAAGIATAVFTHTFGGQGGSAAGGNIHNSNGGAGNMGLAAFGAPTYCSPGIGGANTLVPSIGNSSMCVSNTFGQSAGSAPGGGGHGGGQSQSYPGFVQGSKGGDGRIIFKEYF